MSIAITWSWYQIVSVTQFIIIWHMSYLNSIIYGHNGHLHLELYLEIWIWGLTMSSMYYYQKLNVTAFLLWSSFYISCQFMPVGLIFFLNAFLYMKDLTWGLDFEPTFSDKKISYNLLTLYQLTKNSVEKEML